MVDQPASPGRQAVNALKLVADVGILPGTSRMVDGEVGEGVMYALVGVAAKLAFPLLGPLGYIAAVGVGLDSFSRSVSGRHLWESKKQDGSQPVQTQRRAEGI